MTKSHSSKQVTSLCHRALELINQSGALPNPANFELFYTHAQGNNEALSEAVELRLSEPNIITSFELDTIYETYLAPKSEEKDILDIGGKLNGEIKQVMKIVMEAANSTDTFDASLSEINANIDDGSDPDQVKEIVASLVQATKEMGQSNLDLKERLVDSAKQVDQVKRELEAVQKEAKTDALTGIANRKSYDQTLDQEIALAKNTGQSLCLCMIDIDHFKKFNDTFGHQAGDMVLKMVASMFKSKIRDNDFIARYGGEEFSLISSNTGPEAATLVADRMRQALMKKELVVRSTGQSMGRVTISIGVGIYTPGDSAESLIERADACLYRAKKAGRNRIVCDTGSQTEIHAA